MHLMHRGLKLLILLCRCRCMLMVTVALLATRLLIGWLMKVL